MIKKSRVVSTRSTQDIEKLINQLTQGKTFIINNNTEKRDIDIKNARIDDIAQVLGTLILDLMNKGIIQR